MNISYKELQSVTKGEKREILFHEEMRGQNDDDLGKLLNLLLLTNSKAPNKHYNENNVPLVSIYYVPRNSLFFP